MIALPPDACAGGPAGSRRLDAEDCLTLPIAWLRRAGLIRHPFKLTEPRVKARRLGWVLTPPPEDGSAKANTMLVWQDAGVDDPSTPADVGASERGPADPPEVASVFLTVDCDRVEPIVTLCSIADTRDGPRQRVQRIDLALTSLHSGGKRFWWVCPVPTCGRRVGVLFCPPDDVVFACRHCHGVRYASQRAKQPTK